MTPRTRSSWQCDGADVLGIFSVSRYLMSQGTKLVEQKIFVSIMASFHMGTNNLGRTCVPMVGFFLLRKWSFEVELVRPLLDIVR